jgi:hypothetical protein
MSSSHDFKPTLAMIQTNKKSEPMPKFNTLPLSLEEKDIIAQALIITPTHELDEQVAK